MPGDTCFLGHSGQIFKSIFLHQKHMFLAPNFIRIPDLTLVFFCTMRRTSENRKSKWRYQFLAIYYKYLFIRNLFLFCGNRLLIKSKHKVVLTPLSHQDELDDIQLDTVSTSLTLT